MNLNIEHGTGKRVGVQTQLDGSTERITFPLNDFAASLKMGRNFEDSFATANSKI
jgi:hypothetical protein